MTSPLQRPVDPAVPLSNDRWTRRVSNNWTPARPGEQRRVRPLRLELNTDRLPNTGEIGVHMDAADPGDWINNRLAPANRVSQRREQLPREHRRMIVSWWQHGARLMGGRNAALLHREWTYLPKTTRPRAGGSRRVAGPRVSIPSGPLRMGSSRTSRWYADCQRQGRRV